jgi:hypothetical protein
MNASAKTLIIFWSTFWALSFVNLNTWHLIYNNFNLNFIFGTVCLYVCLRILVSPRIPRYDLGRRTPHFWGGSVTDFPQRTSRCAISNCCLWSSQIRRRCRKFHFEVFQADLRMPTCHGISTAWHGGYLISVIAMFTRWISSRWQYHWSMNCIGITLKPPLTLEPPWESSSFFGPIKRQPIMLPPLISSTMPIVILVSSSLFTLDL